MRTPSTLAAAALLLAAVGSTAPALAHGDADRSREVRTQLLAEEDGPQFSGNVEHLGNHPGTAGISGCFLETAPTFVTSGLESLVVWDVSDAANPARVGELPNLVFENEAMNCGERRTADGTRRFALVGVDLYQASPGDIQHVNAGGNELVVVEVTDPAAPTIVGRAPATTSTHTVACVVETDCRYAYSAGDRGSDSFSIFDLRDLENPKEVDSDPDKEGVQPFWSPTAAHKWNFDGAGIGTHTGFDGSSMWDVDRPRDPRLLATTGKAGGAGDAAGERGYNDFIHHNSFRPNARAFEPAAAPSLRNGNVLLVTEEDYEQTDCAKAGSFQTWHVRRLDGGRGGIVPLDKVELVDLGNFPAPHGAFCSAHWFDYRAGGVVAIGYYGGGTQLLDVSDPERIRSLGYAHWGASEVWDVMWVPVYGEDGRQTGRDSNVAYAIDLVRGLDVYRVALGSGSAARSGVADAPARGAGEPSAAGALPAGVLVGATLLAVGVRRRVKRTA